MFNIFVGIYEFIISIFCIIGCICALCYYGMTFIEERIHKIKNFLKVLSWSVIAMSILMPLSNFPSAFFFLTLISHGIILFLLYTCYPYVYVLRVDFIVMIVITFLNNCLFMIFCFSEMDLTLLQALSYFIIYIWGTPLFFIISLSVTEEATEERRAKGNHQSFWAPKFRSLIKWIREKVPRSGDKLD